MEKILDKAKELGNLIIETEEYKRYFDLRNTLEEKNELAYADVYLRAKTIIDKGFFDKNNQLYKDAVQIVEQHKNNRVLTRYIDAEEKLNAITETVGITLEYVTGLSFSKGACCGSKGNCGGCGR